MERVDITIFYLEMLTPSRREVPAPRTDLAVTYVPEPSVPYYRSLHDAVGSDYHWLTRKRLSDEELAAVIHDPQDELHVLHVDGNAAGFAELDRRRPDEIELVQFGLMSEFIGQGLGKWFLQWVIDQAWSYEPNRLWLRTCTLDHPAALPNYKKAGFVQLKEVASHKML